MKIRVKSEMSIDEINKYLVPVKEYGNEKINNNMYDDWNELEHTTKWIQKIKNSLEQNNEDILDIYYLKDKEKIIGVIFVLLGNNLIREFMKENNISSTSKRIAQLSCFHIIKDYRGIGKKWLESEVLKDLREQGIQEVYIKSSHNKALSLYDRIGTKIGNYLGISDNKLYQRLGYIYKINL